MPPFTSDPTSTAATSTPLKLPVNLPTPAPKSPALPQNRPPQPVSTAPATTPAPQPQTPNLTLDEPSRQKLDGIVQQMTQNKESDAYIQNVVNDFKQKYGKAPAAPTDQNANTLFESSPVASQLSVAGLPLAPALDAITGSEQTFGKAISTIGSGAPAEANDINTSENASKGLLLQAIHNETRPDMKQHLLDAYQKIWGSVAPTTAGDINPGFNLSGEQVVGSALGTALDAATAGTYGAEAKTGELLTKAPSVVSDVADAVSKGKGIISDALQGAKAGAKIGAPLGAAYGVDQGLQNNEDASTVALSGATGAAGGVLGGAAIGAVTGGISGGIAARASAAADQASADVIKIGDTISPKLNSKETQAAIAEGRVTRSPDSGLKVLLFGKQPDIVAQSEEVKQAAQTIADSIPEAEKMDDTQLYSALDDKVSQMATSLQGDMQATPISKATTGQVFDSWKALKTAQEAEPEFDNFAGSAKSQAKFENYLNQLQWDITDNTGKFQTPTPKTLDDVWTVRKAYDASIPANVKNATEASNPTLQWQKTMWLQNRAILNSAINDTASGLGNESKQAFAQMSDMYMSQQNILSKAKVDTKGTTGILPSNKSQLLKWGLSVGGGAVGLDLLAHKLGL